MNRNEQEANRNARMQPANSGDAQTQRAQQMNEKYDESNEVIQMRQTTRASKRSNINVRDKTRHANSNVEVTNERNREIRIYYENRKR